MENYTRRLNNQLLRRLVTLVLIYSFLLCNEGGLNTQGSENSTASNSALPFLFLTGVSSHEIPLDLTGDEFFSRDEHNYIYVHDYDSIHTHEDEFHVDPYDYEEAERFERRQDDAREDDITIDFDYPHVGHRFRPSQYTGDSPSPSLSDTVYGGASSANTPIVTLETRAIRGSGSGAGSATYSSIPYAPGAGMGSNTDMGSGSSPRSGSTTRSGSRPSASNGVNAGLHPTTNTNGRASDTNGGTEFTIRNRGNLSEARGSTPEPSLSGSSSTESLGTVSGSGSSSGSSDSELSSGLTSRSESGSVSGSGIASNATATGTSSGSRGRARNTSRTARNATNATSTRVEHEGGDENDGYEEDHEDYENEEERGDGTRSARGSTREYRPRERGIAAGIGPSLDDTPLTVPRELNLLPPFQGLAIFGKPFLRQIRAVGYQPTPIGKTPYFLPHDPKGDFFSYTFRGLHERDLGLMRKAGFNAVRLWGWNEDVDHTQFLDLCWNGGDKPVYVIPTFQPEFGVPKGTFDITDDRPAQWLRIEERWGNMLNKTMHHPAVLMYLIGNEPNVAQDSFPFFLRLATKLGSIRNSLCSRGEACWHPISVPLGEAEAGTSLLDILIRAEKTHPKAVDVYSVQVFRGASLGPVVEEYKQFRHHSDTAREKPLFVSEYGMDALDFRKKGGEENEQMQAETLADLWREIDDAYFSEDWTAEEAASAAALARARLARNGGGAAAAGGHVENDGYYNEPWVEGRLG